MIDTDVETGAFFPPHMRVVKKDNNLHFIYPINTADEYRSLFGDTIIIEIEEENEEDISCFEKTFTNKEGASRGTIARFRPHPTMVYRHYGANADSEFVRQVKIKLGIVAADAYF